MVEKEPESAGLIALAALVPALVAASWVPLDAPITQDKAVLEALGLGGAGLFHGFDAWLSAPFMLLPVGTRALRAAMLGPVALGATSALLFATSRALLLRRGAAPAWAAAVALMATWAVTLSHPLLAGAAVVGSPLVAVTLAWAAVALPWGSPAGLATLVLLFTTEPTLALAALLAHVPAWPGKKLRWRAVLFSLVALLPAALFALHARSSVFATSPGLFAGGSSWSHASLHHAVSILTDQPGVLLLVLAAVGIVLAILDARTRGAALGWAVLTLLALLSIPLGAPATPFGWHPLALLALTGVGLFASIAMHEAVSRVARARVPMAGASASMIVLLEAAFPIVALDDATTRHASAPDHATLAWNHAAFSALPAGALVLPDDEAVHTRLLAALAAGDVPGDLSIVPTYDAELPQVAAALAKDPRTVPVLRDIALLGAPKELSLSTLAAARPLVFATDPRWDRPRARHLVAAGLFSVFEAEPRGGADRKHALEAFAPDLARLDIGLGHAPGDPVPLFTAKLLFDRALLAGAMGEHEVAEDALEEVVATAPSFTPATRLAERLAEAKGSLEVADLFPDGLAGAASPRVP